eukprot:2792131-Rhodomonas_salina.2
MLMGVPGCGVPMIGVPGTPTPESAIAPSQPPVPPTQARTQNPLTIGAALLLLLEDCPIVHVIILEPLLSP